jgi:deoxyribose-phosphate aldolase
MVAAVAGRCQVKAAGGIRQINEVLEFLRAGARRFGSSRTDQLVQAYQDLPEERKDDFGEFLVDLAI